MAVAIPPNVAQRMVNVREAFRLHRQARVQRSLWLFYLEHNLFEHARDSRLEMIRFLRSASQRWRMTIGMPG